MEIEFLPEAVNDLQFFVKSGNKQILKKISQITESIILFPYEGIGKPEALKYELSGKWSRRITNEHRFIYQIQNNTVFVFSLRGHYL